MIAIKQIQIPHPISCRPAFIIAEKGDTYHGIAIRWYGTTQAVISLKLANNSIHPSDLVPGKKVVLP